AAPDQRPGHHDPGRQPAADRPLGPLAAPSDGGPGADDPVAADQPRAGAGAALGRAGGADRGPGGRPRDLLPGAAPGRRSGPRGGRFLNLSSPTPEFE